MTFAVATDDYDPQRELREEYHGRLGCPGGPVMLGACAWYALGRP